jgi:hypothetical protein
VTSDQFRKIRKVNQRGSTKVENISDVSIEDNFKSARSLLTEVSAENSTIQEKRK